MQRRSTAILWALSLVATDAAGAAKEPKESENLTQLDLATLMSMDVVITSVARKELPAVRFTGGRQVITAENHSPLGPEHPAGAAAHRTRPDSGAHQQQRMGHHLPRLQ